MLDAVNKKREEKGKKPIGDKKEEDQDSNDSDHYEKKIAMLAIDLQQH